jgi:glycosyltransferase involved in cell wall biosynthesis
MPRIALDLRLWRASTGGIGRYSRNLLTELVKLDHDTQYTAFITPTDEPEFTLEASNLQRVVVDIPHYSRREQSDLPKILKAGKFDLVHFANFNHPILYRRPFIVTIHDVILSTIAKNPSKLKQTAYEIAIRDCKRARKVIVPSKSTRNDLANLLRFDPTKVVITPEGSEGLFREHSEEEKASIKKKLGLPDRYLLFVSRWERYKGLPALIEAYEAIKGTFPNIGLVIAGRPTQADPETAALVERKKSQDPQIVTPGFVSDEDLAAMYSAAAVYVHPSWYEGFGIMILEAFASGVPVVTSNLSSLPEVVGDAGVLVDPKRPNEVAEAVLSILADPNRAQDLIAKGYERNKQFSWNKMAEQTLAVYREVLS